MISVVVTLIGVFFLGALLGTGVSTLAIRIKNDSVILGRPRCANCRVTLKPRHMVPVLSWIMLRGRCAFCRRPIHAQYPIVETLAGVLFLIAFVRHPFLSEFDRFSFEALLSLALLTVSIFDIRWKLLPLEFIGACTVVFGFWNLLAGQITPLSALVGLAVGISFLGLQVLLSHGRWLGSGDPWMGAWLGAVLGWPGVGIALYFTYLVGGLVAVVLLFSGRFTRSARLAFAPLLSVGLLLTLWFGPRLQVLVSQVWYGIF